MLTAVGLTEVFDHLLRVLGSNEEDAALDIAQLELMDPVAIGTAIARTAGFLRARNYHRTKCAVSLADCVAAAVAASLQAPLATADPHLLDLCHSEGIAATPLPDAKGRIWSARGTL